MCKKKTTKLQTQNRNVTVTLQACTRPEKTYFSSEWYLPSRSHWDSRCRNRHSISQKPDLLIQECRIFKREGQSATTWKFFVTEREKCSGGLKWHLWLLLWLQPTIHSTSKQKWLSDDSWRFTFPRLQICFMKWERIREQMISVNWGFLADPGAEARLH